MFTSLRIYLVSFILLGCFSNGFAFVTGDFRTNVSGGKNWSSTATWQRYNSVGAVWESAGVGGNNPGKVPGTAGNTGNVYIITAGLTLTLDVSPVAAIASLSLTSNAILTGNGTTLNVTGDVSLDQTSSIYGGGVSVPGNCIRFNAASITIPTTATAVALGASGQGTCWNVTGALTISGSLNLGTGLGSNDPGNGRPGIRTIGSLVINATGGLSTTAPSAASILDITGNASIYGNITCNAAGAAPAPVYNVGGNLFTYGGSLLGTSPATNHNLVMTVAGNWTVDVSGTTSIDYFSITISGSTAINGTLLFAGSSNGLKQFRAVTVAAGGIWDDVVGESMTIDGNIVNNGNWYGCTGGQCTLLMGGLVTGTYAISGNNVSVSVMTINASTIINNNGTVSLDGSAASILTGAGTFNNLATGILNLQGAVGVAAAVTITAFNASTAGNVVHYNGAGAQAVHKPTDNTYSNLVIEISGTKTFEAAAGVTIGVANNLTIKDAAILNVQTNTLSGAGGLTMLGTSNLQIAKTPGTEPELTGTYSLTAGTVTLNGAGVQTLRTAPAGASTYYNLVLSGTSAKTITGMTILNGDLTVAGTATIAATNSVFTQDCGHTFFYQSTAGTSTLGNNITIGNFNMSAAGVFADGGFNVTTCGSVFTKSAGTYTATGRVTFNAPSTAVTSAGGAFTFKNVTINSGMTMVGDVNGINIGTGGAADWTNNGTFTHNSGTITSIGNATIQGTSLTTFYNLTISAGTLTGHATQMFIEGNWTNNSAYTANAGKVTFSGALAANLAGTVATTFYNMEVNKTSNAVLTQTTGVVIGVIINTPGTLIMTAGVFTTGTNRVQGTGGLVATGGDLQMAFVGTTLPELSGTGLYSITGGTVTLNGAGAQTLQNYHAGTSTYNNLYFSVSGAKTITGTTVINGDVTVTGTATITANSAFIQDPTNTFTYNSTSTSTLTAATAVSIGFFVENAAGVLDINGSTCTVGGNWTKSAGTFTNGGASRVIFAGTSGAQTYTDNGSILTRVSVNNASGVTLSNDMTISTDLTFTNGNITTGINNVILNSTATTVTGAAQGVGFVNGNLRKVIAAGASTRTYETGAGAAYSPLTLTFTACGGGNITCTAFAGDHAAIFGSGQDPAKTVNVNWEINNNSAGAIAYSADFAYQASSKDAGYDYTVATVFGYDGVVWNPTTMGALNPNDVNITGQATPGNGAVYYFEIGDLYTFTGLYNRLSGAGLSWSAASTWIQYRTGTVTASGTTALVGVGTKFLTELAPGDIIMLQTVLGTTYTVSTITDDTHLVLMGAAAFSGSYGREHVPGATDFVNIGNINAPAVAVGINMDIAAPVTISKLQLNAMAHSHTLTHTTANALSIISNVIVQQGIANLNLWDINTGTATITGDLVIGNNVNTANTYNAKVSLSTGTINVGSNIILEAGSAANAVNATLVLTGAGTINESGVFQLDNATAPYYGTFTPGGTSIFNYNSSTINQTLNLKTTAPAVIYNNVTLNNTFTTGITLGGAVTAANITGNLSVVTGTLNNGGFAMAGAAKTFSVANLATFKMTGAAVYPTGFTTFTMGATSNTYYLQSAATAIANIGGSGYGNLYLQPSGAFAQSFAGSVYTIQGNMTVGDGTNATTVNASAATATVNVTGDVVINPNGTLNCSTFAMNMAVAGSWTNNGGTFTPGAYTVTFNGAGPDFINGTAASQTFNNVIVAKTAGTLISCGGSTTALTVSGTYTNTTGNFTAPATMTITGIATLTAGTFSATDLTFTGTSWINNGGTFTHTGTITFNNVGAAQQINGTAAAQTFNNVTLTNTGRILSAGGSTVTLNVNNLTSSGSGSLTAPATFNIAGNVLWNGTGTWIMGTNTFLAGNITYNAGGTLTPGANTFTFNGSTAQTLNGTGVYPAFNNLTMLNTVHNGLGLTLNNPISITTKLTLTDGHINNSSANVITMPSTATVQLNAATQDSSFVKGYVAYTVATVSPTTVTFPVGSSTDDFHRADLTITQSAATSTTYTSNYISSSAAGVGYSYPGSFSATVPVSLVGYWNITSTASAAIATASVTLYYETADGITDIPNLTIAKGDPNAWIDIGASGAGAAPSNATSTHNFTGFSFFAWANKTAGSSNLPIELLSFNAVLNNQLQETDLTWTTASEINNDYFTVERTTNGIDFDFVGKVKGAGNSTENLTYTLKDLQPLTGISYYRLKQTDFNGTTKAFTPVPVDNNQRFTFNVFPNPSHGDELFVALSGEISNKEILVVLYNANGQSTYSKVIMTGQSNNLIEAIDPTNRLAAGVYFVVASSDNAVYRQRIIIY